jgi:hypothetical protein
LRKSPDRASEKVRVFPDEETGMRQALRLLAVFLCVAAIVLTAAVSAGAAPVSARSQSTWSQQADQVCSVWLAKVKKAFATPVTTAQLYAFAVKARSLESGELSALEQIPGRNATGTAALTAVRVDIAEIGSAITAWDQGNPASFVTILKRYLNDNRPASAFKLAGADSCG